MKAIAVHPGKPNSVHLRDVAAPKLTDQPHPHVCRVPEGRGVLVKTLQIGVDATDREINEAVLRVRLGLLNDYDPLVQDVAMLKQAHGALDRMMPTFLQPAGRDMLREKREIGRAHV